MKNDKVLKINYLKVVALSANCNDLEGIIFGSSGEKRKMQSLGKAALTRNAKVQKMRIKNRTPGRQDTKNGKCSLPRYPAFPNTGRSCRKWSVRTKPMDEVTMIV